MSAVSDSSDTGVPLGVYMPDQWLADVAHDPAHYYSWGGFLQPVCWIDDTSPVVTFAEFARFIAVHAANDRNGNWGQVWEVDTPHEGRVMVLLSGDEIATVERDIRQPDPDECPASFPSDGMTVAEMLDRYTEMSWWRANEGDTYSLAECDWDEWCQFEFNPEVSDTSDTTTKSEED